MSQDNTYAGLHAVVAEDSAHMRALLRSMLRALGFAQVTAESNGGDALRVVETNWPDVALVDWNMPEMNGIELAGAIRALDEPLCRTPIIMVTAHASQARLAEAARLGVNSFLCKPLSVVGLDAHLRKVIRAADEQPMELTPPGRRERQRPVVEAIAAVSPSAAGDETDENDDDGREAAYI
jgi:CheY-like chemotaxis protein